MLIFLLGDIAGRIINYKEAWSGGKEAWSDNDEGPEVTVLDVNEEMLSEGKLKHKHKGMSH